MVEVIAPPEIFLCDTSYLGAVRAAGRRPHLTALWPADVVERLAAAILAISVITVAEERAGEIKAGWGEKAVAEAASRRRSFAWIPLDTQIVERWAQLDAQCKAEGRRGCDDNDLWIVATGIERELVLVTCDKRQSEVPSPLPPIYLPLTEPPAF
jgi:predicted nucleic acid-binding protein